jgi:23S rRNA (uridine2552-2'-O)-methyltransferase
MAKYQPHDRFYRKARQRGLPSRAAFKIEELLERFRLARPGARVADLGCAPGGWLSILAAAVGPQGRVAGIDVAACAKTAPNVVVIAGDIRDSERLAEVALALGGKADLVTSDLAPKLTGVRERDQAQMLELVLAAANFGCSILRPGGAAITKVFMGEEFKEVIDAYQRFFRQVDVVRTRASRPGSSELYLVARDYCADGASE